MNKSTLPIIDKKQLNQGPADLVKEIYAMLKQQLPESQRVLNTAMATKNWEAARAELHKLQGSCAYCGLARLGVAASDLYKAVKSNNPPSQDLLDRFNTEVEAVMGELNKGFK